MINDRNKSQIFGSVALVTGVVILVAIAALIVGSIFQSSVFQDTITNSSRTNETLLGVDNITATNFGILTTFPNAVCELGLVFNTTNGVELSAGNFTQPSSCTILATDASSSIGFDWDVTYNFTNVQNNIAGLNVSVLSDGFSDFVIGIITFLGIIGIIIGIVWLISYLRPLFSREDGIQSFAGN